MGENSSPWTKFDPLTTNSEFATLAVWIFVGFHKS